MNYNQLKELCKDKRNICIFGHLHPDGDSVGATMGLKGLLANDGIETTVILKDVPEVYNFLEATEHSKDSIESAIDLAITLDCGDIDRVSIYKEAIEAAEVVVNIDHHTSNTNFGDYNYVIDDASSTCEIVFNMLEDGHPIDQSIANALYTGIVYDTGAFKHSSTTSRTHIIAARLIEEGIDFTYIINRLFYYRSNKTLQTQARAIDNMVFLENEGIAYTCILQKDIKDLEIDKSNTEGIVQLLIETYGVECCFFIYELEEGKYKASLRTKGAINVSEVARKFGGGGHVMASGLSSDLPLEELITALISEMKKQLK